MSDKADGLVGLDRATQGSEAAPKNEQTLSPAHMLAIACLVVVRHFTS